MFFYNPTSSKLIDSTGIDVKKTIVFDDSDLVCFLCVDGTFIVYDKNLQIAYKKKFIDGLHVSDVEVLKKNDRFFVALQFVTKKTESTLVYNNVVYEFVNSEFSIVFSDIYEKLVYTVDYTANHFFFAKVMKNDFGFSFLKIVNEKSDFENFNFGAYPGIDFHKGIDSSFVFNNYFLESTYVFADTFVKQENKIPLNTILGRSWFENNKETFIRHSDVISNLYLNRTSSTEFNLFFLLTAGVAKTAADGLFFGNEYFTTSNCGCVVLLNDAGFITFKKNMNCFGTVNSKEIPLNSFFDNFFDKKNIFSFFDETKGKVFFFLSGSKFQKITYTFNKNTKIISSLANAYEDIFFDLNRSFSFRITGDQNVGVSDYLLQYPRPENFFSETLPYKFDNLSFFSTKEKQIFNVSKVLKLTVNFNNVNAFTGSPDFFVNKNKTELNTFVKDGTRYFKSFSFETANNNVFKYFFSLKCNSNESVSFSSTKQFFLNEFIILSKKLYNIYDNFGGAEIVFVSDDLPVDYQRKNKIFSYFDSNYFCVFDVNCNNVFLTDSKKLTEYSIFKKKSDFALSVSNDVFKVNDIFTLKTFEKKGNLVLFSFTKENQFYYVELEDLETDLKDYPTFAYPEALYSTGTSLNEKVSVRFTKVKKYPFFPVKALITDIASDFLNVTTDVVINWKGDVPGFFDATGLKNIHFYFPKVNNPVIFDLSEYSDIKPGNKYTINVTHDTPNITKNNPVCSYSIPLKTLDKISVLREGFSTVLLRMINNPDNQNSFFSLFLFKRSDSDLTYVNDVFYEYGGKQVPINEDLARGNPTERQIDFSLIGLLPDSEYLLYVVPVSVSFNKFINIQNESIFIRNIKSVEELQLIKNYSIVNINTISVPNIELSEIKKIESSINFSIKSYLKDDNNVLYYTYNKKPKIFVGTEFKSYHSDFIIDTNYDNKSLDDVTAYSIVPSDNIIKINNVSDNEDVFLIFNFINKVKSNEILYSKNKSLDSVLYFSGSFSMFDDILAKSGKNYFEKGFVKFFENDEKRNLAFLESPVYNIEKQFDFVKIKMPVLEFRQTINYNGVVSSISFDHRFLTGYNFYYKNVEDSEIKKAFIAADTIKGYKIYNLIPGASYKFFIEPCFTSDVEDKNFLAYVSYCLNSVDYVKQFTTTELKSFPVNAFAFQEISDTTCKIQRPTFDFLRSLYPSLNFTKETANNLRVLLRLFDSSKKMLKSEKISFDDSSYLIGFLKNKKDYFLDASVALDNTQFSAIPENFKPFSTKLEKFNTYFFGFEKLENDEVTKNLKFIFSTVSTASFSFVVDGHLDSTFSQVGNLITVLVPYTNITNFSNKNLIIRCLETDGTFSSDESVYEFIMPFIFENTDFSIESMANCISIVTEKDSIDSYHEFLINGTTQDFFSPKKNCKNKKITLKNLEVNSDYSLTIQAESSRKSLSENNCFNPVLSYKIAGFKTSPFEIHGVKLKTIDTDSVSFNYSFKGLYCYAKVSLYGFDDAVVGGFSDVSVNDLVASLQAVKDVSYPFSIAADTVSYCVVSFFDSLATLMFSQKIYSSQENIFVKFDGVQQNKDLNGLLNDELSFDFLIEPALTDYSVSLLNKKIELKINQTVVHVNNKSKKTLLKVSASGFDSVFNDEIFNFNFSSVSSLMPSVELSVDSVSLIEKEYPPVNIKLEANTVFEFISLDVLNTTGADHFLCELFYKEKATDSFSGIVVDKKTIISSEDFSYEPNDYFVYKDGFYKLLITSKNKLGFPLNNNGASTFEVIFPFKSTNIKIPKLVYKTFTCEPEPIFNILVTEEKEFRSDYLFISADTSVLLEDNPSKWVSYNLKNWNFIVLPFILEEGKNVIFVKGFNDLNQKYSKIERIEIYYDQESTASVFPNKIYSNKFYGENDGFDPENSELNRVVKFNEDFTFTKLSYRIKNEHGLLISDDTKTLFSKVPKLESFYIFTNFFGENLADGKYTIELFLYDKRGLERKLVKQIPFVVNRTSLVSPRIKRDSQIII